MTNRIFNQLRTAAAKVFGRPWMRALIALALPFLLLSEYHELARNMAYESMSLGGFMPYTDSAGYWSNAMQLLEFGRIDEWGSRRCRCRA